MNFKIISFCLLLIFAGLTNGVIADTNDQDILKLIDNLSKQKLIKQASLSSMKLPKKNKSQGGVQFKGFRIFVRIKG